MVIRRGEIWWAELGEPVGSGPGFRRPVIVIQANAFNKSALRTVIVLVVSSNLALDAAPGNVRLGKQVSSLPRASVVNVSQIMTIDRGLLIKRVRQLPEIELRRVDKGLGMVLGLGV